MNNIINPSKTPGCDTESDFRSYLGKKFAELFAKTDSEALFLAYLWEISVQGHLCLSLDPKKVVPHLPGKALRQDLIKGKDELQERGFFGSADDSPYKSPVIAHQGRYYLQKNWVYESAIVSNMLELGELRPDQLISDKVFGERLHSYAEKKQLLPEQIEGLRKAKNYTVSFLLGGPGTGKTYTAAYIIESFFSSAIRELRFLITAPTGKAAAHLQEQLQRRFSREVEAKTVHSLLGMSKRKNLPFRKGSLPYDVIIVDESSMLDVSMIAHLLCALKRGSRIIFMGDPHQLPPIESGSAFFDLSENSPYATYLQKAMRFEDGVVDQFAKWIFEDNVDEIISHLKTSEETSSISFLSDLSNPALPDLLRKKLEPFLQMYLHDSPEKLCSDSSLRLLSTLREGYYSVAYLNDWCSKEIVKRAGRSYSLPIVLTQNSHVKRLYNGMQGVVHYSYSGTKRTCRAYFKDVGAEGAVRLFELYQLPKFSLGFCLSVHKSQGSEFQRALLFLPPGSESFGKELFYTAVTRIKEKLEIVGEMNMIDQMMQKSSLRASAIKERLYRS